MHRRDFLRQSAHSTFLLALPVDALTRRPGTAARYAPSTSYRDSFYLLHLDHHTKATDAVGRGADPVETERLINLARPDLIQIHAKGKPGWTTYPTQVGFTPPGLTRDVQAVWQGVARRNQYTFFIYYNIGRDGELMKRRPDWNRRDADGQLRDQTLCYHTGVAEAYIWPMLAELLDRYQPDGFWFDGSVFTIDTCYCQACQARFRRERGLDLPPSPEAPGWADFKEMHRQVYREFVRDTVAFIKQKAPGCQVGFNFAYSFVMPEPVGPVDYLTHDIENHADHLSKEAHYFDSTGLPFDLMTALFLTEQGRKELKPIPQLQQEMALIIANGGRYFAWDDPTPDSALLAERYTFQHEVVAPFLRARQAVCLHTARLPEGHILLSATDHYQATLAEKQCFPRADRRTQPLADALSRAHLDYAYLTEATLTAARPFGGPQLLVQHPTALNPSTRQALDRYVRRGGHLVWVGPLPPDDALVRLLGVRRGQPFSTPQVLRVPEVQRIFRAEGLSVVPDRARVRVWASGPTGERYPLLTEHPAGRGRAYVVAFTGALAEVDLFALLMEQVLPPARRRLTTTAPATVEVVLRHKPGLLTIHAVNHAAGQRQELRKQYGNSYYRVTSLPPVPASAYRVRLAERPRRVWEVPTRDQPLAWTYAEGILTVEVPSFEVHQIVCIEPA